MISFLNATETAGLPAASSSVACVPARNAFLDKSAHDDAADAHPAAGGDGIVTGGCARVDSADSNDNAADKEDNALATTFQPPTGAR